MDLLFYALPLLVLAAAAAWVLHARKRLRSVLEVLAGRCDGRLQPGPLGLYPTAVLPADGGELFVSGMHGSKRRRARTYAWVACGEVPGLALELWRKPPRVGALERLGQRDADTGHGEFDRAFWMRAEGDGAARELLDRELRGALLAFDSALGVRLRVGPLHGVPGRWAPGEEPSGLAVSIRRFPPTVEQAEALVELARSTHDRLLAARQAVAA